jgi:ribonuclease HII
METFNMTTAPKKFALEKDAFEKKAWNVQHFVIGVDEVGRGCFAGPVLAAAVILPLNCTSQLLKDSKVLTKDQRDKAYEWIIKHCAVGIGMADHTAIDHVNIYQATIMSMHKALHNVIVRHSDLPLDAIVVDAVPLTLSHPHLKNVPVHSFIKGETYSRSIAAASIVAKVTRDRIMDQYDTLFAAYNLKSHKGYGTAHHQTALQTHGPTIIHRKTFITKFLQRLESDGTQQTLF